MAVNVVIAYDIASGNRRARLAAALQSWGYRIQESVFEIRLEADELEELEGRIAEIIEDSDDVVHVYRLCRSCKQKARIHGTPPSPDDGELFRALF